MSQKPSSSIPTSGIEAQATDYYTKQIKAKMDEIDKKNKTLITIPYYSSHLRTFTGGQPRQFYQTEKYHYMSLAEHLCKLYEVDPYIYGERDDAYKNKPPYSHVYPCSSGCPQCSHIPVYINPQDPFRQNPPVLDLECNKSRQKRWIEFTELNEYQVIREEIEEGYDAGIRQYVPRVRSQLIMPIEEARRLVFLMQQDNFSYEDYFGRSPDMIAKPKEILNKGYLDDQLRLIENVGDLRKMLREQEEKQKQLEEEIERLRQNGNNNNNNNNNDGNDGDNNNRSNGNNQQYTLQVPNPQRKKKIFEDDGLNYYTKRNFQNQPARIEQTQGESSLRNIPGDSPKNKLIQMAPTQLELQKKYNQYKVKPSQRDLGNLKTVKHEDPTYQSNTQFFEQQRQQSTTSISQVGGIQRKFKPSSEIKLHMRAALSNDKDEYYDHQTSLTDIQQQAQSDAQHFGQEVTITYTNLPNDNQMPQQQLVGSASRQNILQAHNQRVASLTNLDLSNSFSRLPPDTIKKQQNQQIQQVLEQYYEETPQNNNRN